MWINQGSPKRFFYWQEEVLTPNRYEQYYRTSSRAPSSWSTLSIDSKWTDSEGNIWYRCYQTFKGGCSKGMEIQVLRKLNKSATVLESVFSVVIAGFDPRNYPAKIDPKEPTYNIFARAPFLD